MSTSGRERAASADATSDRSRERRRLELQGEIDAGRTLARRNERGQFATPPALASEIARLARALWSGSGGIRFLEPALGTGGFYSAMREAFADVPLERAVGFERDNEIAAAAAALWRGTPLEVERGDFLAQRPPVGSAGFNLILTNPPYVRHHHMNVDYKSSLRSNALLGRRQISGLASLYVYFLLAADAWLAEGGLAIWLLPHEFLDVNYGSSLREYLAREVTLLSLHRFPVDGRHFTDALVTSCVLAYQKPVGSSRARSATRFSMGDRLQADSGAGAPRPRSSGGGGAPPGDREVPAVTAVGNVRWVTADSLESETRWTRFFDFAETFIEGAPPAALQPRESSAEATDAETDAATSAALGDFFTVRRGIATGANEFFILERDRARELGIPPEVLRPILPSPRRLTQSVIESDPDGDPLGAPYAVVIDCSFAEGEIRERWPAFARYIDAGRERGVHLRYLPRHRSPWYSQERREPAPFLCSYMGRPTEARGGRPFRFFSNRSRAIAPNVYLMLYPKARLADSLDADPGLHLRVLRALTQIPPRVLVRYGRVYGGGLYKFEPRELRELPVPELARLVNSVRISA